MKRTQSKASSKSSKSSKQPRAIEPRRLAEVRAGADLGITVTGRVLTGDIMENQHNEALIRL